MRGPSMTRQCFRPSPSLGQSPTFTFPLREGSPGAGPSARRFHGSATLTTLVPLNTFAHIIRSPVGVPESASDEAIEKAKAVPEELRKECERLFEDRPLISRLSIYCRASDRLRPHLKALLPSLSYYWVNGPWRHTWARYGIDPRQDPAFRALQILECRNAFSPPKSATAGQSAKGRRGGNVKDRRKRQLESSDLRHPDLAPDAYLFDGTKLTGNFFVYQMCDLVFDSTRAIVEDPERWSQELDEKEGWFREGTLSELRAIVKDRWTELMKLQKPELKEEYVDLEELLAASASGETTPFSQSFMFGHGLDQSSSSAFASALGLEPLGEDEADEYFIYDE